MKETKPGLKTTEFWSTGGLSAGLIELAQSADVPASVRIASIAVSGALIAWYTWARAQTKSGGAA